MVLASGEGLYATYDMAEGQVKAGEIEREGKMVLELNLLHRSSPLL